LGQARAYHYRKVGFLREFEKVDSQGNDFRARAKLLWEGLRPLGSAGMLARSRRTRHEGCRHPGTWWNAR